MTVCCPKCKTTQRIDPLSRKIFEHERDPVSGTGESEGLAGVGTNRFLHVKIYMICRGSGARVEIVT